MESKLGRQIQALESGDELSGPFLKRVSDRVAELERERFRLLEDLRMAEVVSPLRFAEAADLLDCLPLMEDEFLSVDEEALRGLFDAMRLEVHYNKLTDKVEIRVTVDVQSVDSLYPRSNLAGAASRHLSGQEIRPDVTRQAPTRRSSSPPCRSA